MTQSPRRSIDWDALLDQLNTDTPEREQATQRERMRQRAQQYAALPRQADTVADGHHLLIFDLGHEHYGIDVLQTRLVRPIQRITPVPGTPRFYPGVVNVRGQIITALDLRLFFHLETDSHHPPPREMIVAHSNGLELGLLAHHVRETQIIPAAALTPLDEARYAHGITASGLIVLDIVRLFADERLIIGGAIED